MQSSDGQPWAPSAPPSRFAPLLFWASVASAALAAMFCYGLLVTAYGWSVPLAHWLPSNVVAFAVVAWMVLAATVIVVGIVEVVRTGANWPRAGRAVLLGLTGVIVTAGFAGFAASAAFGGDSLPPDAQLINTFGAHRAQFAAAVAQYKRSGRVSPALLKNIGVHEGVSRDEGGIALSVATYGISGSGAVKGYVYSRHPLRPTQASVDEYGPGFGGVIYRHVKGPWYLFLDYEV